MSFFVFRASDMATLTAPVAHPDLISIQEAEFAGTMNENTAMEDKPQSGSILDHQVQTFPESEATGALGLVGMARKKYSVVPPSPITLSMVDATTTQDNGQGHGHGNSTTSTSTILRRTIRYGCTLCPGFHCDRKARKGQGSVEPSLQKHVQQVHPERVGVWETLVYQWGRRVKYSDGRTVDEPEPGNAPSIMDPGRPRSTRS